MESERIQPDFDIFCCKEHLGPGKGFVVCCVAVSFEPSLEKCTFRGRQPGHGRGVVGYEPVGYYAYDDGSETFLLVEFSIQAI
jgi:hypothetical protein